MLGVKWRQREYVIDLSNLDCHVCGKRLIRDITKDQEWCVNSACQVKGIRFNISYK